MKKLAVVTGATGIIGRKIVEILLADGLKVRVLTRNPNYDANCEVEIIKGDLMDRLLLENLMLGADWLFHCAAELNNESKMDAVNVTGTRNLINASKKAGIQVFCHMSSVGVIGIASGEIADEYTECHPQNTYERTKYMAEQLIAQNPCAKHTVILRPTNVVSESKLGPLDYVVKPSPLNYFKIFLKGQEKAHLIHANDVAAATVFCAKHAEKTVGLLNFPTNSTFCTYILSLDHEPKNIVSAVCRDYLKLKRKRSFLLCVSMPWRTPYYLRKLMGRPCNRSDLVYSSAKLLDTGFCFPLGLDGAIRAISEDT